MRPDLLALEERQLLSTFTVSNTLDDGSSGSLRWAIGRANSEAGADTIDFDAGVFSTPRTITLTGAQLELSDQSGATTIEGPAGGVTVSGGGLSRVFQVDSGVAAAISGMTITGGDSGYYYGGGLYSLGATTLTNCTVSGNSAWTGAGLAAGSYFNRGGSFSLTNCTISGNSGGNAFTYFGGPTTATNTIIAGTGGGLLGRLDPASSNNVIGGNPLLAPLGLYGGTSLTMPLLPGSPAIDAGTDAGAPATDQRGEPRFGGVDVGAFQSQGFTFTVVPGGTPQSADIGTAFANPLAVAVTANSAIEPVDGGIVGFVAHPAPNGATAILSRSSAVIAAGGVAVDAMPNNALGSYTIDASVAGSSASFSLTNTGTVFTSLVVNTTSDAMAPGVGLLSLREAIAFDNTSPTGNLPITFDEHVFGNAQVITLTGSQLELSNPNGAISITGPKKGVTIDGGGLSRVFQVDAGVVASISGATITGGDAGSSYYGGVDGGGLLNYGTLTLQDCTVTGNITAGSGGGLFNNGTAKLINSTISGNSATGNGGGLFNYGAATLINSTLSGNSASYNGGGLFNYGAATLINSTLSGNSAYRGGGLFNRGEATLTTCTVSGNTASYGGGGVATKSNAPYAYATTTLTNSTVSGNSTPNGVGGGLSNEGTTTLTGCTVSGNSARVGGGLFSSSNSFAFAEILVGASVSLTDCTVIGNSATEKGGGVYTGGAVGYSPNSGQTHGYDALTNLTNCTLSGNFTAGAGGGLATGRLGTTTATNTTIRGNSAANGGGVSTEGLAFYGSNFYGTTNLDRCTVAGNSATGNGGGLSIGALGIATLSNVTIGGNASGGDGGGVANNGKLNATQSTVADNSTEGSGGGVHQGETGSTTLTNSLISGNRASHGASSVPDNLGGKSSGFSGARNLIGGGSASLDPATNLVGIDDALLAPLGNYGGQTETYALLPGSPAIDAAIDAYATERDQRGLGRVGGLDIGAFESQGFSLIPLNGSSPQTAMIGTAFSKPLAVTVKANNPIEPVDGGLVTFQAPKAGASAALSATKAVIANGTATVNAAANAKPGSYAVSVSTAGAARAASFSLTNTTAMVSEISVGWGSRTAALFTDADGLRLLPAGRKNTIGWTNVRSFTVQLLGTGGISAKDVTVTGLHGANYGSVKIKSLGNGTYLITLARPILSADRVTLTISNAAVGTYIRRLDVLPGDVNDDGLVNAADFNAMKLFLAGQTKSPAIAGIPSIDFDLNGDESVNLLDYLIVTLAIGLRKTKLV